MKDQEGLLEAASRLMPGGSPNMLTLPDDVAAVFVRGEGARLFDADGRGYVDFVLGSGPMVLGHAHPAVVAAVRSQVALGSTFYALNPSVVHLAQCLVDASPCGEKVRFTTTGTDATFFALRMARAFTGRQTVLKFDGGWHGAHDIAQFGVSSRAVSAVEHPAPESGGIPDALADTVLVAPFNDTGAAADLITARADRIAAVIVEPMQRAIPPEPGFLQALRQVTERHGIVLIFDEVVTGFRLAWGGAQERYGVTADIAVYGKTITGGHPQAAVCGRADILDTSDPARRGRPDSAFVSGTFLGNPVSAAAGLATLAELEKPGVYPRLQAVGDRIAEGLESLGAEVGVPLRVVGDGPVRQPFFTEGEVRSHRDEVAADAALARRFGIEWMRRGVFVTPGGKLYLSLAHTDADLDRALDAARPALEAAESGNRTNHAGSDRSPTR